MGALAFIIIFAGFIGFPLLCFIFYVWYEYQENYITRACMRADKKYYQWEQSQKKKQDKS